MLPINGYGATENTRKFFRADCETSDYKYFLRSCRGLGPFEQKISRKRTLRKEKRNFAPDEMS
jgi:hypothetical protein